MNLKALARQHTAGGVTWWLMPYATLRHQAIASEFAHIVPRERWETAHHTFVMLEGSTVEVACPGDDQAALRLRQYWDERPLDLSARWNAFSLLMSDGLVDSFWAAYFATREPLFEGDAADPNVEAVSGQPS